MTPDDELLCNGCASDREDDHNHLAVRGGDEEQIARQIYDALAVNDDINVWKKDRILPTIITTLRQRRGADTETFQDRVQPWLQTCFGAEIAANKVERNHRFLEEALELVQACGCTESEAYQLVDYTFNRPSGNATQEVGGVMVTLAALCLAQGFNMHASGETELQRIWTKVDIIRAKQAAKPQHSPLPETVASADPYTCGVEDAPTRLSEMLTADYSFIAIASDRKTEKDRDITGDVEALVKGLAAAQTTIQDLRDDLDGLNENFTQSLAVAKAEIKRLTLLGVL